MLLGFLMARVFSATATEFTEFETISCGLLILSRHVVATLTIRTLQYDVIARHLLFPISDCQFPILYLLLYLRRTIHRQLSTGLPFLSNRQSAIGNRQSVYSNTSLTVPA